MERRIREPEKQGSGKGSAGKSAVLLLAILALLLAGLVFLRVRQQTGSGGSFTEDAAAADSGQKPLGGQSAVALPEGEAPTGGLSVGAVEMPESVEESEQAISSGSVDRQQLPADAAEDTETFHAAADPQQDEGISAGQQSPDEAVHGTPKRYTKETYQLVTDMVYAYRNLGADGWAQVEAKLSELKNTDPALGVLWEAIMTEWDYVSRDLPVNTATLPESLPQDDSLCIVVMGYHLKQDGSMEQEMLGRCEVALRLLERYPNAFLALTGGGTASLNREATEADVMAEWFLAQGIPAERMILENQSQTTGENAKNTCAILKEQYAQVKELVVVSSDYHIPQSTLLLTEAAYLYAYTNDCPVPYVVSGNAAYQTAGSPEYNTPANLWTDIWVMANPDY